MTSPRDWIFSAAVCCACWACGDRPDPPGPAASSSQEDQEAVTVYESQPRPADDADGDDAPSAQAPASPPVEPNEPPASASESPPAPVADAGTPPPPAATGLLLAACLEDGGGCSVLNIAVTDEAGERCIELSFDNCRTFDRAGIPVDTPVTWRFGSASAGDLEDECVPAAYDPDSAIIVDGSGTIGWNLETRRPSDLVLDVSLEPASGAAQASPIDIQGSFAGEVPDCE